MPPKFIIDDIEYQNEESIPSKHHEFWKEKKEFFDIIEENYEDYNEIILNSNTGESTLRKRSSSINNIGNSNVSLLGSLITLLLIITVSLAVFGMFWKSVKPIIDTGHAILIYTFIFIYSLYWLSKKNPMLTMEGKPWHTKLLNILMLLFGFGILSATAIGSGLAKALHYLGSEKGSIEAIVISKSDLYNRRTCSPRLEIDSISFYLDNYICPNESFYQSVIIGQRIKIIGDLSKFAIEPHTVEILSDQIEVIKNNYQDKKQIENLENVEFITPLKQTETLGIERQKDNFASHKISMPRRKFIHPNKLNNIDPIYSEYVRTWEDLVENTYANEFEKKGLAGELVIDVALNPNGSINEITIRSSSGNEIIDDTAISIVKLAAPYAPFSELMKKETDILHISRSWQFFNNQEKLF